MLGLSPFWATVVRVELINLAFSIDSILVAVAMSPKPWVVITGGILGIVAMRLVVGQLLVLVSAIRALVDGAFVIIAWVGIKLGLEYLHERALSSARDPAVALARLDRRDLHRRVHLRPDAGTGRDSDSARRTSRGRCSRLTKASSAEIAASDEYRGVSYRRAAGVSWSRAARSRACRRP